MKTGYSKWNIHDHLKNEKDIQGFLDAAFEDYGDEPDFIMSVLKEIAHARNMQQLAKDAGISRSGLYKALSGEGKPEFSTILKIMGALGLKLQVTTANSVH